MQKRHTPLLITGIALFAYALILVLLVQVEAGHDDASINSIGDAVWYSLVTITSVGYGDYYPVTTGGKFLGGILVLCSVGLFGYIVGSLGNRITK